MWESFVLWLSARLLAPLPLADAPVSARVHIRSDESSEWIEAARTSASRPRFGQHTLVVWRRPVRLKTIDPRKLKCRIQLLQQGDGIVVLGACDLHFGSFVGMTAASRQVLERVVTTDRGVVAQLQLNIEMNKHNPMTIAGFHASGSASFAPAVPAPAGASYLLRIYRQFEASVYLCVAEFSSAEPRWQIDISLQRLCNYEFNRKLRLDILIDGKRVAWVMTTTHLLRSGRMTRDAGTAGTFQLLLLSAGEQRVPVAPATTSHTAGPLRRVHATVAPMGQADAGAGVSPQSSSPPHNELSAAAAAAVPVITPQDARRSEPNTPRFVGGVATDRAYDASSEDDGDDDGDDGDDSGGVGGDADDDDDDEEGDNMIVDDDASLHHRSLHRSHRVHHSSRQQRSPADSAAQRVVAGADVDSDEAGVHDADGNDHRIADAGVGTPPAPRSPPSDAGSMVATRGALDSATPRDIDDSGRSEPPPAYHDHVEAGQTWRMETKQWLEERLNQIDQERMEVLAKLDSLQEEPWGVSPPRGDSPLASRLGIAGSAAASDVDQRHTHQHQHQHQVQQVQQHPLAPGWTGERIRSVPSVHGGREIDDLEDDEQCSEPISDSVSSKDSWSVTTRVAHDAGHVAHGALLRCRVVRHRSLWNRMHPVYEMYFQSVDGHSEDRLVFSARRRRNNPSEYVIWTGGHTANDRSSYSASVSSNLLGTQYTVRDGLIKPQESAVILYKSTLMKLRGAPRTMTVVVPRIGFLHTPSGGLVGALNREAWQSVLVMKNIKPRLNPVTKQHVLDFGGRVTVPSVKNFQLAVEGDESGSIVMQFGKNGPDSFALDFREPLMPLQAFAIALSSCDGKLACE